MGIIALDTIRGLPLRVLSDQTVIVSGGRIQEIGPYNSIRIPEGVTRIDATGQFLIPAFSDMHVHLLGDAWNIMFPPEARIPADFAQFESHQLLFTSVYHYMAYCKWTSSVNE